MAQRKNKKFLKIQRFFTKEGVHPYEEVNWVKRIAEIPGSGFKLENVEFPDFYSQNAVNIIASKYFKVNRGKQETSLKELIDRVVKTFKKWALEQGYFDEKGAEIYEQELTYILLHQLAAFNSPVWFNVGVEGRKQQCHACFILDVEDNMESILDWIKIEGMIFKGGSGAGVNLSKLRGKGESLSTGGHSSGVISFMKAADAVAGSIKCIHEDTEIITKNGIKKIKDIQKDDEVLTRFGFQKVGEVYYTGKKSLKKITTDLGIEIIASPEHKFLVRTKDGQEIWKELKDLNSSDRLILDLYPKEYGSYQKLEKIGLQHHNEKPIKMPDVLDERMAEWLGLLFGDGNITEREAAHYIGFQVCAQDRDLIDYIRKLSFELFGVHLCLHTRRDKSDKAVSIRIASVPLIRFLKVNGLYKDKGDKIRVPEKIKNSPLSVRAAFLRGYFESDGTITAEKPYPQCSSINKDFINDIQLLLFSLGILNKKFASKSGKKSFSKKIKYRIIVTSYYGIRRFYELVNFISHRKRARFAKGFEKLNIRPFEQSWILPYFENDFEYIYSILDKNYKYPFRRATSKYFRESVGKTNFNRFRANVLLEKFDFLRNTFIEKLAAQDIYYEKIKKIEDYGVYNTCDIFVPEVNEYLINGIVTHNSGGTTRRAAKMVVLNVDHPEIMDFIRVKADEENKIRALMEAGYDMTDMNNPLWQNIFFQNANNSIRATDEFMKAVLEDREWTTYYRTTKKPAQTYKAREILWEAAKAAWECGDPGIQFHDIVNKWHTCKNSGEIVATNPCSEYNFLNWTSCNLASINLLKFLKEDGNFDIPAFKHTVRMIFLSQDILISPADYPYPKIAEETKKYRTIGLGYTNLGALIMALGLPYDSDSARSLAASITSLMTGYAYQVSTEIAEVLSPFPEYEKNREPMLEVMKMHREESYKVPLSNENKNIIEEANKVWDKVIERGEKYGFRNAQASVIAPTGCLTGNSLVSTERGLVPIETLGNPLGERWQDLNITVMTDEGEKLATKFFVNGLAETVRIRTKDGYEIIGTPEHRIKVFDKETGELKWKYFADIKDGDVVALEMNTIFGSPQPVELPPLPQLHWNQDFNTKVPRHLNPELAELVGYFMGDGSLHSKGLRFCVYKEDKDVIERLRYLIKNQFNLDITTTTRTGYIEASANSIPLALWWEACGFAKKQKIKGKGWEPHIPLAILYSNDREIYKAFLRGLFEADGTVWKDAKVPALSTHSKIFHDQIKALLLALGFPTKSKIGISGWGRKNLYVLYIKNREYAFKFKEEIGFISKRKNGLIEIGRTKQTPRMDRIFVSESLVRELMPVISKRDRDILRLEFKRSGFISRYFAKRILTQTKNPVLDFYVNQVFFDEVIIKENNGEALTYDLSVPENVTYIANGFISHNTISFMMDADTTGIEPDFALVKMKQLAGGGWMKIVNNTVPIALRKLGYSEKEIEEIVKHLEETQNIESAPHLKEEHLPIFDCAVPPPGGKRSISLEGHLKMVAAVQPFISGGISKTFNMPNSATIEDVYNAFITAWQLGIKCVAIYRDGSKATQALFTQKKKLEKKSERKRLPDVRQSETHKFSIAGHEGYLTYSMFEDGSLGEIFIRMSKQGSTLAGLLDAFAIAVSIALQYGVPLKELASKFIHMRFEPMGITNNKEIPMASSIVDYIFKYLALRFLSPEELKLLGLGPSDYKFLKEHPQLFEGLQTNLKVQAKKEKEKELLGPPCKYCGGITVRTGNCYTCRECGESSGGCG